MEALPAARCLRCEQLEIRIAELEALLARQQALIAQLQDKISRLEKHSGTSSKPPSSDIVKPPKAKVRGRRGKRKIGGQPGHPRHERDEFPPERVDQIRCYKLLACPCCGGRLEATADPPQRLQQIEVATQPITVHEHQALTYRCRRCRKVHRSRLPKSVRAGGLFGPRLTATVAFLKGVCHASFSTIRKYVRDVLGVTVSSGYLASVIAKVSEALAPAYAELAAALPDQDRLNVDETGHKDRGARLWTWCLRAPDFTVFHIDQGRDAGVLLELLGSEFAGVLGCDYFGAYRLYMDACDVRVQFCLAHLIRDVKFLLTLANPQAQRYGQRLRDALRRLFEIFHKKTQWTEATFREKLAAARECVLKVGIQNVPAHAACQNLAKRFRKHGRQYFEFVTTPGIEPTNNLAEQAIRFVVIDRKVTQGTRGSTGQKWSERIWTCLATCAQQGRSAFDFLHHSVTAAFEGRPTPSLIPQKA